MALFYRDLAPLMKVRKGVFDVKCSLSLIDEIKRLGLEPCMNRTGSVYCRRYVNENGLIFAHEHPDWKICCEFNGIEFFVTGGIGGVHRKAQETFDISADLDELGKTNVSVICAGPKAILDLHLTMEYLETKGVPVIGYNTDNLPAFFTRTSDLKVDYNAKTPLDIAKIVKSKREYKLDGGVLITNPIPEEYSMDPSYINAEIDKALLEMEKDGIHGKDETPYLLAKIVELTKGKSLEANIKLILNNAKLGTLIASEYAKLK